MVKLEKVIESMAKDRPVFHSEGDLQYTLARCIEKELPNSTLRIEYPVRLLSNDNRGRGAIDIWWKDRKIAIELKYKTVLLKEEDDTFKLRTHLIHNGRYGFVKDIEKLEKIVVPKCAACGFALLITNDAQLGSKSSGASMEFGLHKSIDGGKKGWHGAQKRNPINLAKSYSFGWKVYSSYNGSEFRYLLVKVEN